MVANTLPKRKADEIVEKCSELLKAIKEKPNFEAIHDWNVYVSRDTQLLQRNDAL